MIEDTIVTNEEKEKNGPLPINWDDINVEMFSIEEGFEGDKIEFKAFEHAPQRIQNLFIRDFLGKFISDWAGRGMGTPADYDSATKVGYC